MKSQDAQSSKVDIQSHIIDLFQKEIVLLENLRDIMASERQALGAHDVEKMNTSSAEKRAAVTALESASTERFRYLRELGIDPHAEQWFTRLTQLTGNQEALSETYDRLIAATKQCRAMNQINGLLINRRERLTSEVINLLRANDVPPTYSELGQSVSAGSARTIGKA